MMTRTTKERLFAKRVMRHGDWCVYGQATINPTHEALDD